MWTGKTWFSVFFSLQCIIGVALEVGLEFELSFDGLATKITGEGTLLLATDLLVPCQMGVVGEGHFTIVTLEWAFSCVRPDVCYPVGLS